MKVIKRNGTESDLSRDKIYKAIVRANNEAREANPKESLSDEVVGIIATRLYERCRKRQRPTPVEEIQEMIETELMKEEGYETAKRYIRYRCMSRVEQFTPVLYSTGCVACRTLKDELDARGIQYEENNDVKYMLSLGFDKVPMLETSMGVYLDFDSSMNWIENGGNMNEEQ